MVRRRESRLVSTVMARSSSEVGLVQGSKTDHGLEDLLAPREGHVNRRVQSQLFRRPGGTTKLDR